ncbi:glycine--tRNA ligase subunit beta [Lamprobacter modestohalophilus]|uniref:Glycine--tRNA ligase beta subunit n=1 Tax=Lamprobacter modestohalophilus TaxID=1064514 RepID=A0A9X0W8I4_9GAMM|nr:glycine--tRNA ligase subunit beta [Lamprobacter modestohalophilus]MBK1618846.1 glycine--tRNA ligase subunit beta [Lamprobacter modestohalophilus]
MSSHNTADLLVEIGTEELPPAALAKLSTAFCDGLLKGLDDARLAHGSGQAFASPRRLAVILSQVALAQPDEQVARRGPALKAAFNAEGAPTKAALGFAQSCGVAVDSLEQEETEKGAWLCYRQQVIGKPAAALLPELIDAALAALPIPKRMRWGNSHVEFVRPVHWVCVLLGDSVIPGQVLGIEIDRLTRGHRFHHPDAVRLSSAADYLSALRGAYVEADLAARRSAILEQVASLAAEAGGAAMIDESVLDEVTALCEWPVALLGRFDPGFLEVPSEVLIETMQANQKYFPVVDRSGSLLPFFITVSNIQSRDPDQVRAGNERVIRPRFADAKFFWEQDLKTPLGERVGALQGIVFQHKLGTLLEKTERVAELSAWIAEVIGGDSSQTRHAARLAKADLVTLMVGEFGSLQGVMGRYYAERSGEAPIVAAAIEQHYWPKHAGDHLPETDLARAVAIADRADTLVGIFAIGLRPTGVKDPYGLRRAAIGVLRILIETPLALDLRVLFERAAAGFPASLNAAGCVDEVLGYCVERLKRYYADAGDDRSADADVIASVLALDLSEPVDIDRRIQAVQHFRGRPEASALAAANKRTRNILRKVSADEIGRQVEQALLQDVAEQSLAMAVDTLSDKVTGLLDQHDYNAALAELSSLRQALDDFFDQVMVMADEPEIRANRLALLKRIETLFHGVADISLLQG